jgi:hypothetical protein
MPIEKAPYYLLFAAVLLFAATLLLIQPYSVTSPWHVYDAPARVFLEAAARADSLALARQTSDPEAVRWGLAAAQLQRDSLALWSHQAKAWAGNRQGDTTDVFLSTQVSQCNLVLRFVGPAQHAKVQQASSTCLGPHQP